MCIFCAPVLLEPDADDRERVLRVLAELEGDEPLPPGAAAAIGASLLARSTPDPAVFRCEAAEGETPLQSRSSP
jgi:hypothetical protein